MAMAPSTTMVVALAVAFLLCSPATGETHSECGIAQTAFSYCVNYLVGMDPSLPPKCCAGVEMLNRLVYIGLDVHSLCRCLGDELTKAGGAVDRSRVESLHVGCRVPVEFDIPTGPAFDCNH